MSALRTAVSMLGMYDDRTKDAGQLKEIGLSLIAKVPVMVAYYYRLCQGLELPRSGGSERGGTFPVVAEG